MIILSKAIEPKAASATSTYPAIIVRVGSTNESSVFVNLQVFCPSTMSGGPRDALYASNNWVEAPIKPHNGENVENYDFKVGGMIIISYANGNINSPQFVRYVEIKQHIIEMNYDSILTNQVIPDSILDIWDTSLSISSSILKRAVSFLPQVRICASGDRSNVKYLDTGEKMAIRKCGVYGIELISNTFRIGDNDIELTYLYGNNRVSINFYNIMQYFYSNEDIEKDSKLSKIYNLAIEKEGTHAENKASGDMITSADTLYLYNVVTGLGNGWEENSVQINRKDYENFKNEDIFPNSSLPSSTFYLESVNGYDNTYYKNLLPIFWKTFDGNDTYVGFKNELNRVYAIILHNNISKLQNQWQLTGVYDNILLIGAAIIATAYPSMEYCILRGKQALKDENSEHGRFLDEIKDMAQNLRYNDISINNYDANIQGPLTSAQKFSSGYLAYNFSILYFYNLGITDMENSNVEEFRQYIQDNIESMFGSLKQNMNTIVSYPQSSMQPSYSSVVNYNENSNYIWPCPASSKISSHYGPRIINGKEDFHNGMDISVPVGNNVIAANSGTVTISKSSNSAGLYVAIRHDNGDVTRYLHNSKLLVKVGQRVNKGDIIAKSGNTGYSTGPHLHFDITIDGKYVNPEEYVRYI